MRLTIPSQTPITVSQGQVSKVYDKWAVSTAHVHAGVDKVGLTMIFSRCREVDGDVEVAPFEPVTFQIDDILSDPATAQVSAAFFQAVVTKVFQAGLIS